MAHENKPDPRRVFITPELPRSGSDLLVDLGGVVRVTRLEPLVANAARFRLDVQGATGVSLLYLRVVRPEPREPAARTKTSRKRSRKDEEC